MANTPSCQPCPISECGSVFDRVVVSYLIRGQTRVMWELLDTFLDPMPFTFQLQAGLTGNPNADDWTDVGLPVTNQYFAVDDQQRVFGKTNWAYYRVRLETSVGTYYSIPTNAIGTLGRRDWRIAREFVRKEKVDHRLASQYGYLLKRRITGKKCLDCTDYQTEEVRNPDCPNCYATGFECGYFFPMHCVWAKMSPRSRRTELDAGQARGTVNDVIVKARMLMTELLGEDDVWVNAKTDDRYYIHRVEHISEVRGVPVIAEVELRLIPYTSIIYTIPIPQMQRSDQETV